LEYTIKGLYSVIKRYEKKTDKHKQYARSHHPGNLFHENDSRSDVHRLDQSHRCGRSLRC
jgi:hypothetical protein